VNKFLLKASKRLLIVAVIVIISIVVYAQLQEPIVYKAVSTTEEIKGTVYTSEMAFQQSRQIGKVFGYENMWSYVYNMDQSPDFVKKSEEDGWFSDSAKSVGYFFLGKEYNIELPNYFMLGYDFSDLKKEDVTYMNETKTLLIHLPELELSYTPDYAETEFNSHVGLFRMWFSDEEKHRMYNDSVQIGVEKFINDEKEEIKKGHEYTQNMISDLLLDLPEFSEHVNEIKFVHVSNGVNVSIDEYKEKIKSSAN